PYQNDVVGVCPRCGAEIVENAKAFGCVNWPQPHNCKFTLWKEPLQLKQYNAVIDKDAAIKLLKGETAQIITDSKVMDVKIDDSQKSEYGPRFVIEKVTDQNDTDSPGC
ncbi:MAG: hypothetical protein IJN27_00525, partial [Oscillospiraceae bacterium]|nr:hypothetical protein [Oscillospiraceae bacterium]